ncbi:MAG: ABC transporter ATP-binding protein [Candidatus Neomarinimicrobiota bacterium]|nr:MAG: ABC transporter ATP-binding protein [Candidatus Neomarinimicrobiota bacterium]
MENVIKITGLTKDYKQVRALEDIDLQISRGRIVGLLGKNGAGKSTLLKCLLDFLRYEGDVEFFGKSTKEWKYDLHTRVAFIPDVSGLDPRLTVQQTIDYVAGINPSWNSEKAERLFAKSELPRNQKVKTLSKGMKTKLYLMLTLAKDVDILLLDEPTLGLDIVFRKEFFDLLLGEFFDESKTVIISTHQVAEVENILQDVVFIDHGKVKLHQPVDKLKKDWSIVEVSADREQELMAFNPKATSRSLGKVRGLVEGDIKLPDATVAVPSVSDIFVAVVNQ